MFGSHADAGYFPGVGPLDFYVPGYIALVWAASGCSPCRAHGPLREDGVQRRLRASSAPRWLVLSSQFAVSSVVSLVDGGLVILAAAFTHDIHTPRSVPGFLLAWRLCAALFGSLGLLFANSARPARRSVPASARSSS